MSFKRKIRELINSRISPFTLDVFGEKDAILTFLFHSVFRNRAEMELHQADPQQATTLEDLNVFIEYFLEAGYHFISPEELTDQLPTAGKHILITFDDGYYNNTWVPPILEKYNTPAIFYISTDHVIEQKSYWWDALYRNRMRKGGVLGNVRKEQQGLKHLKHSDLENYLIQTFGPLAIDPIDEIDRPMTARELSDFAKHPLVHIGNHTHHHAILTNYTEIEVESEIETCNKHIREITGKTPQSIAYPNGNVSRSVVEITQKTGITTGITTVQKKNYFPIDPHQLFLLNRYMIWGNATDSIAHQCKRLRSDFKL